MVEGKDPHKMVVVVDDDPHLLELAVRALERGGVPARGVSDLAALMAELDHSTPSLILMDVNMPELFGDEVGSILKQGKQTTSKIILHSSHDEDDLRKMVREGGLDGYIPKSLGTKHMVRTVRELLSLD